MAEVYSMIVVNFLEMILFILTRESFLDKKKEDICMHIADSFCCTLETNTTM